MDIVNLLNDPRLEDAFKSPNCDELERQLGC